MPSSVLIIDSPSAPAPTQPPAMSTMSVTSGESFANTGTAGAVCRRTACTTSAAATGSQAKTWPRSATFGQEMFTSMAASPGAPRSRRASSANSSTLPPAIDTTAWAPARAATAGRARGTLDAGALQADRVEHAAGRLGHPWRRPAGPRLQHDRLRDDCAEGRDVEELVELAPAAAQPEAVSTGLGRDAGQRGREIQVGR